MCGKNSFYPLRFTQRPVFDGKEFWRISVHPNHRKLWLLLRRPINNNIVLRQERDFSANKCHFLGLLTFNFPSLLLKRLWGPVGQRRKARHGETSNWLSSLCCSIIRHQHSRCWLNSDETCNFAKVVKEGKKKLALCDFHNCHNIFTFIQAEVTGSYFISPVWALFTKHS